MDFELYSHSSRTVEISLRDVPAGDSVAKGLMMVKRAWSDADGAALISKSTATAGQGGVDDSGANPPRTAVVRFEILPADVALLESGRTYFWAAKAILASGKAVSPSCARGRVKLVPGGIVATS